MKKFAILLFVGLLGFAVKAQEKKAEITFETDVIDYGEVAHGGDGVRSFKFTNTGNEPLIISRVNLWLYST